MSALSAADGLRHTSTATYVDLADTPTMCDVRRDFHRHHRARVALAGTLYLSGSIDELLVVARKIVTSLETLQQVDELTEAVS